MTSSQYVPYVLGHTHATMDSYSRLQWSDPEPILKTILSSDCRLQFACMKSELLVTAYQLGAVNTFSGLVHTARHVMKVGNT
jgi:hypothetical protein